MKGAATLLNSVPRPYRLFAVSAVSGLAGLAPAFAWAAPTGSDGFAWIALSPWVGLALVLAVAAGGLSWRLTRTTVELRATRKRAAASEAALEAAEIQAKAFAARIRDLSTRAETLEAEAKSLSKASDAVHKAKEEAEAANRSKTEFLAMMSHELRTPLNAILGFSEIIRSEALGKLGAVEYREYASDIYTSGAHLLALINDLLDLAKVESGMVDLREDWIDPGEMIGDCARIIRKIEAAHGIQIKADPEPDLPRLRADKRKVNQILMNILSNAVKFTPPGKSVTVAAFVEDGSVVFEVTDEGIGIAPDDIARVVEPFIQIDSALNRTYQGTGLGLPLCKQLTDLHGGSFEIKSVLNQGTTVRVTMPAARTKRSTRDNAAA